MFHNVSPAILERMAFLEQRDAQDRTDGTPRSRRLRQIPPETGKFIALLAASTPPGPWIEIGSSAGYSTLWLALACLYTGRRMTTYEVSEDKAKLARETMKLTGVDAFVDLIVGDAREHISGHSNISFCFLDAEKEIYADCYEAVVPRLTVGGLFVADNAVNHYETLKPMLDRALADIRVDALIVPIGKGELVCRKV